MGRRGRTGASASAVVVVGIRAKDSGEEGFPSPTERNSVYSGVYVNERKKIIISALPLPLPPPPVLLLLLDLLMVDLSLLDSLPRVPRTRAEDSSSDADMLQNLFNLPSNPACSYFLSCMWTHPPLLSPPPPSHIYLTALMT